MTRPAPLHVQVARTLRNEIRDHRLPPGSALPTEAELQERFGVARSVVRQAMATLVAEGLVRRGRGRGSVVAPAGEYHRVVARPSGLSAQLADEGLRVTTQVLVSAAEPAGEATAELGAAQVLRLERLRCVDGEPLAYIRTWLPLPRCAAIADVDLTDASLHEALRRQLGLHPTSGRRQVRAVAADADLAALLGARAGEPLLLLEGTSLDQHGEPVEVFATWHRGDRVAFDVDVRDGSDASATADGVPAERLSEVAATARRLAAQLSSLTDRR